MTAVAQPWLDRVNRLPTAEAVAELHSVCSSARWAQSVAAARPFADAAHLEESADRLWLALEPADWLEALDGHPRIGESGGSSAAHSEVEQSGVARSASAVLDDLRTGNAAYEARFGHVFLIAAAGRDAEQILAELNRRLANTPQDELREAANEHRTITRLRLRRLLDQAVSS